MGLGIYSLNLTRYIALTLDIRKGDSSYKITKSLLKYTLNGFRNMKILKLYFVSCISDALYVLQLRVQKT